MATDIAGTPGTTREGSPLAVALRDCLVPALLTVGRSQRISFTPEARQMLNLPSATESKGSAKLLPEPLLLLARHVLDSQQPISGRTLEVKLGDGSQKTFQISACPAGAGEEARVLLVLNDLAALGRFEAQLLQVDRLATVGALAPSMAHEIKNALVPCKTFIDLLLEKNQDVELAELVRREIKRMDELVSRMLKDSAPEARVLAPVRLHQILDHALRVLQPQFASKSITVTRFYEAGPDVTQGDPNELQQAFMNLLLNAMEAVAATGVVTIRTLCVADGKAKSAEICVAVEDDGIGIPSENLGRIFEPFFTTKPDGTGLGLAITQRIVQGHHGRITVESSVGKGTVFAVFLPA